MDRKKVKVAVFLYILLEAIFLISILAFYAIPWALKNYPMHTPFRVFSVLTSETSGHDSTTFVSALLNFIIPGIFTWIVLTVVTLFFYKKNQPKRRKIRHILRVVKSLFIFSAVLFFVFSFKFWQYPKIFYESVKNAEDSDFYKQNFINYSDLQITSPEQKQNLIVIFLESMESSYTDIENGGVFEENLIPNLTKLAKENVNFTPTDKIGGSEDLACASWTVSSILGKFLSVPYYFPFTKVKNGKEKIVKCLPNAISLSDILKKDGYNCLFSMGSEKSFENRDALLELHGFEIHDINWYKKNNYLPVDYQVFWGFEDLKLYDFAKMELNNLSESEKPFFFSFITVDTHFPKGFKCENCKLNHKEQIQDVINCADLQVFNFIEWCKTQKWFENTTILITGDHNFHSAPLNNFLNDLSPLSESEINKKRKILDIIINPAVEISKIEQINRTFSSFDIMPTTLEAIGYKIKNGGIAFGRSLLGDSKTLVEDYEIENIEEQILKPTIQYNQLKGIK